MTGVDTNTTISPATSSAASSDQNDNSSESNGNANTTITSTAGKPGAPDRILIPNENDVLCGRGGSINSHKGNEQFRKFVEKRKRVYLTARFKREKRLIATSIVTEIRDMDPPGRFLARKGNMKDNINGYWYDIGDEKARDKTSQALRENAPSIRAEIETEIHQQRQEMRQQEEKKQAAAVAAHGGRYHPHPGAASGARPPFMPPPPPPPHAGGNSASAFAQYAQQYYDYYYHYYGYGAPPPPPPPGYPGGPPVSAPGVAAPPAYPGAPPPPPPAFWPMAAPVATSENGAEESKEEAMDEDDDIKKEPTPPRSAPVVPKTGGGEKRSRNVTGFFGISQEEQDRRMAMALQQQENVKAFEDRNKKFGSDRRTSRSAAFCAPGYRPRLLHDDDSIGPHQKRPAMSASRHFASGSSANTFGSPAKKAAPSADRAASGAAAMATAAGLASVSAASQPQAMSGQEDQDFRMAMALQEQEDAFLHNQLVAKDALSRRTSRSSAFPQFSNAGSRVQKDNSNSTFGLESMVSAWTRGSKVAPLPSDLDTKPASVENGNDAMMTPIKHDPNDPLVNHDHSVSSIHSRGRGFNFKEDMSEMFSVFGGDGSTIIPQSAAGSNFNGSNNNNFTPIPAGAGDQHQTTVSEDANSSMWTQVANQLMGTFNASWTDSESGIAPLSKHPVPNNRPSAPKPLQHSLHRLHARDQSPKSSCEQRLDKRDTSDNQNNSEMGTEVVMETRDGSTMPPPHSRNGNILTVEWPSCGMTDTIGASASAFFGHEDAQQDHSLLSRGSGLGAAGQDISPVNTFDMDLTQSYHSFSGSVRRNRGGGGGSSVLNVFDPKTTSSNNMSQGYHTSRDINMLDSNPEDILPHIHRSVLQQVPSWERDLTGRSYRSRSPTLSLSGCGSYDPLDDDADDSLIRVDSVDVKEKHTSFQQFMPILGSQAPQPQDSVPRNQYQQNGQWSPMPAPTPLPHGQQAQQQGHLFLDDPNDMNMDWDAGE